MMKVKMIKEIPFLAMAAIVGAVFGAVAGAICLVILTLGTILIALILPDMNWALWLFAGFAAVGSVIGAFCAVSDAHMLLSE